MIGFLVLIVVILLASYIFIPGDLTVSTLTAVKANPDAAYRCLSDDAKWENLFGKRSGEGDFQYRNTVFKIHQQLIDGVEVTINEDDSIASAIELLRINKDSSALRWTANIESSSNPFRRISQFFEAISLRKNLTAVLDTMKHFLEDERNLYGFTVQRSLVKDTLLIATKNIFNHYPTTDDVYTMITSLEHYAREKGATQTGYPMLNIKAVDQIRFEAMTALPVNRELPDNGPILHKEMVPGNILIAQVTGGPQTVSKAFTNLQNYVDDLDLQSPAIPFQSLVTDRSKEPDTSKWVTRIYYPIY